MEKGIRKLAGEFISQEDTKEETQKFDAYILDLFFRYIVRSGIHPDNISKSHVIQYKRKLISESKSPLTIDKYLGVVRRFYNWLEINGLYENVARNVHNIKRYKGYRKSYLNRDQIITLLQSIDVSTTLGLRDYAMINLMIRTGLRRCEINRLNANDIFPTKMYIIRKGKIEREIIGIDYEVVEPINNYVISAKLKDKDPLFISLSIKSKHNRLSTTEISMIIKNRLRVISDDRRLSCHSLRHTFAINALKGGASIFEVQNALGHESAETTKIYLSMIEAETKAENPAHHAINNYLENGLKTVKNKGMITTANSPT